MKVATSVTRMITKMVGIAIAYFLGKKKSCAGCDVSTNGCVVEVKRKGRNGKGEKSYIVGCIRTDAV